MAPIGQFTTVIHEGTAYTEGQTVVLVNKRGSLFLEYDETPDIDGIIVRVQRGTPNTVTYYKYEISVPQLEHLVDGNRYFVNLDFVDRVKAGTLIEDWDDWELELNSYNSGGGGVKTTYGLTQSIPSGSDLSWQYLGSQILKDTLISNMDAADLAIVTENATEKIFWEGADESWSQPYILTQIITGGDLNSSQVAYAEMLWRVVVHTPNLSTAGRMENAIHQALARQPLVVNFTGVQQAGEVEEATPVTDRYQVQNVPLYVSGGIYRIRLSKG